MKNVKLSSLLLACSLACTGAAYGQEATEDTISTSVEEQAYIEETLNLANNEDVTWTRILMGASEGDMSMFASLNLQIAWLNSGTDADIAWQWDGGHVPSEILGDSFSLYVDEMYGKYVEGAV